jgi:hypothetical protein
MTDRTIVAVTRAPSSSDADKQNPDPDFVGVLERAAEIGRREHAQVILFDLAGDVGPVASSLPTNWSAEGEETLYGSRLDPKHLEAAGRHHLAEQVDRLRADGVQAHGWLPDDASAAGLVEYAVEQGADLILVSAADDQLVEDIAKAERPAGIGVEAVPVR